MFLPNLDGDTVDVPGRRKDGCHGTAQKIRPSSAGLLALGGWCSGGTAFRRGHFTKTRGCPNRFPWFPIPWFPIPSSQWCDVVLYFLFRLQQFHWTSDLGNKRNKCGVSDGQEDAGGGGGGVVVWWCAAAALGACRF